MKKSGGWKRLVVMAQRIINIRTFLIYIATFFVLRALTGNMCFGDVFGGFPVEKGYGMPFEKIMAWNIGILPPIVVGMLYIDEELGRPGIYTMVRSRYMKKWWSLRWITMAVADALYVACIIAMDMLWCYRGHGCEEYGIFALTFLIHIFVVTVLAVCVLVVSKFLKATLLGYGFVEIFFTAAGCMNVGLSNVLLPFWGMVNHKNGWNMGELEYRLTMCGISLVIAAVVMLLVEKYGREKIIAYIKSR